MKRMLVIVCAHFVCLVHPWLCAVAGTWSDDFSESALGREWTGDTNFFSISNGILKGNSISPLAPAPFNLVDVGSGWSDYVVQCMIDVVTPNLAVCTKGALILRHGGKEGYVFALHVATQTIEVYRLSNEEMLLSKEAPLDFKRWYKVRAELQGDQMRFFVDDQLVGTVTDNRSLSGAVGVAVQDTAETDFDDFTVTGANVLSNGLDAVLSGDKIMLIWPSSLTDYGVVTSPQIAPSTDWRGVTNAPVNDGGYFKLSLDLSSSNRFYRLDSKQYTNAFR